MKEDANIAGVLCITRAATATLWKRAPLQAPQMKMPIMATNKQKRFCVLALERCPNLQLFPQATLYWYLSYELWGDEEKNKTAY